MQHGLEMLRASLTTHVMAGIWSRCGPLAQPKTSTYATFCCARAIAGLSNKYISSSNLGVLCVTVQVVVQSAGCIVPHVALFAKQNIAPGEELTFAYGLPWAPAEASSCAAMPRPCRCGTVACLGYLPRDS